ncbi:MAG: glycosyltransferase family 4 protein [Bacteroidales bacterium]|nr:glycosyltransferase family 4 protein [Bacteroidales bacterium]
MRILVVSSILPIPNISKGNDFVFETFTNYRNLYPNDSIVIIKPIKLDINILSVIRKKTIINKLNKNFTRNVHNFHIEVFPFFSSWRLRNIHAIITRTIYCLNRTRIYNLFYKNNFDIIHAQYILPDALLANFLHRKFNIPYVITTHNERFYFEHCISKFISIKLMKNASGVFPINHSNYVFYKTLGIPNLELIPLGFHSSFIREQKQTAEEGISILTVAELIKLKNVDKVILAIGQLLSRYKITYTVVGKGPENDSLKKLVKSLGIENHVHFIESISHDQIANEIYEHDIFIMPSYFETFGRVYFEAMAMGIPIICAKNSGIFGIFKEGEEGISVDHKNVDDIVKNLEYLIVDKDVRLRIGMNGKKLVENFTWENIALTLHNKYDAIINAKHKSK